MAKYQGTYREDVYKEDEVSAVPQEEQDVDTQEPQDAEDASFKKRYGDLRRHMQQTMAQKEREMEEVKSQLEQATRKQLKFPKTEQEIAEWVKKYPDVAAIVDTIAQKRAMEALEMGEKKMSRLKDLENRLEREKAEQELVKMHPDFFEIRADRAFHDWVSEQPQWVQDALYKNETDARSAARAIDLYKADAGIKKKRGRPTKDAAQAVGNPRGASPSGGQKARFSESQVSKMSSHQYEQNEEAILTAMKEGTFEYDITGGAR